MNKNQLPKEAIDEAVTCLAQFYGTDWEKAAKSHECALDDVEEIMDNRFQGVAERFGVDYALLLDACTDFLAYGEIL